MLTPADRARVGGLLGLAAGAAAVTAATYVVFVRTAVGQRLDRDAVAGRVTTDPQLREAAGSALATISIASLVFACAVLVGVALVRGRPRLAAATVVVVGGAPALAEVLKVVLPRPELVAEASFWAHNTLPSGHSTIAASLGLALVMVVPHRHRRTAAIVGFLYAVLLAGGTLAAGWHRPSDAVAGIAVATAVAGAITASVVRWRGGVGSADPATGVTTAVRVAVWGAAAAAPVVVLVAATVATSGRPLVWTELTRRFVAAMAGIVAVGAVAFALLTRLLRDVTLDPPGDVAD